MLKSTNHYDNSIRYTDKLLGEVVRCLRKMKCPSMMMYLSDHGESVESDHWRNAADVNMWEIPMVCWFSDSFCDKYQNTVLEMKNAKDRPLQLDTLFSGLISLFQVGGFGSPEEDFHSPNYVEKKRMIHGAQ